MTNHSPHDCPPRAGAHGRAPLQPDPASPPPPDPASPLHPDTAPPLRQSIRLKGYDYTGPGAYFITICTHRRAFLFGDVVNGEMCLNRAGQVVTDEWTRSVTIRREITLDEFVVMPNHIHGIVWIVPVGAHVGAHGGAPLHGQALLHRPPRSLGSFVAGFKASVTRGINALRQTPGAPVWQRNYHEHIIRTEESLNRIRQYILDNPVRWTLDRENPAASDPEPEDAWAQAPVPE